MRRKKTLKTLQYLQRKLKHGVIVKVEEEHQISTWVRVIEVVSTNQSKRARNNPINERVYY